MDPDQAYQIVHDELMLDGNARLNLATFVSTWMEPQAARLMAETLRQEHDRQGRVPADGGARAALREHAQPDLWHVARPRGGDRLLHDRLQRGGDAGRPGPQAALAAASAGRRAPDGPAQPGHERRRPGLLGEVLPLLRGRAAAGAVDGGAPPAHRAAAAARPATRTPSAWWPSWASPTTAPTSRWRRSPPRSTSCRRRTGLDVPIHVDGASGGFVAPFLTPDLAWDFRLPRVQSINASGHKYGLVYPGVGWIVWRTPEALPEDLVFRVNYLGGDMPTFALNFSRPGAQIVAQYYNLLRLGREGYRRVQQASMDTARRMADHDRGLGPFETCPAAPSPSSPSASATAVCRTRLRPVARAARPGLAGARLHPAARRERRGRAAHRGPQRLQRRPGRAVHGRPGAGDGGARDPAASPAAAPGGVPPLTPEAASPVARSAAAA